MIFDDSFFQLTNDKTATKAGEYKPFSSVGLDIDSEEKEANPSENANESLEDANESSAPKMADLSGPISKQPWSSEYGNPSQDYVIESDLVTPVIKQVKDETKDPLIVVIDDDFDTLDLLKIYLARGHEYVPFSGPREAIFYLNEHVPDLILLDSNIHTIKSSKVIDIIRSYKQLAKTPIIYTCDEYEKPLLMADLPQEVSGVLSRPVSRGNLQYILDKFLPQK